MKKMEFILKNSYICGILVFLWLGMFEIAEPGWTLKNIFYLLLGCLVAGIYVSYLIPIIARAGYGVVNFFRHLMGLPAIPFPLDPPPDSSDKKPPSSRT